MRRARLRPAWGPLAAVALGALASCAEGTADDVSRESDGGAAAVDAGGAVVPGKDGGGGGADASPDAPSGGCTGKVVINEILTGGAGDVTDEEFIELYNPNDCAIALGGFTIKYRSSSDAPGGTLATFTSASIGARAFFVLGTPKHTGAKDMPMSAGMKDVGGQVALLDPGDAIVDAVGWGTASGIYVEKTPATEALPGDSIARKADGVDTGDNRADFEVATTPTPGAAN